MCKSETKELVFLNNFRMHDFPTTWRLPFNRAELGTICGSCTLAYLFMQWWSCCCLSSFGFNSSLKAQHPSHSSPNKHISSLNKHILADFHFTSADPSPNRSSHAIFRVKSGLETPATSEEEGFTCL